MIHQKNDDNNNDTITDVLIKAHNKLEFHDLTFIYFYFINHYL